MSIWAQLTDERVDGAARPFLESVVQPERDPQRSAAGVGRIEEEGAQRAVNPQVVRVRVHDFSRYSKSLRCPTEHEGLLQAAAGITLPVD